MYVAQHETPETTRPGGQSGAAFWRCITRRMRGSLYQAMMHLLSAAIGREAHCIQTWNAGNRIARLIPATLANHQPI